MSKENCFFFRRERRTRGARCLKIFFMNYLDPAERVLFPVIITVRADTAELLDEMANEMELSMDEVLSAIAEESVSEIGASSSLGGGSPFLDEVLIPNRCSTEDLLKLIK